MVSTKLNILMNFASKILNLSLVDPQGLILMDETASGVKEISALHRKHPYIGYFFRRVV